MSFAQIPANWKVPGQYTEFDVLSGQAGLASSADMVLIIAPMSSAGSLSAGDVEAITSAGASKSFVGKKSLAHCMACSALDANPYASLYVVGFADYGSKAVKTITATGTTTSAGDVVLSVGDRKVVVNMSSGSTPTQTATQLVTGINADDRIPFTATSVLGVVTLTAVNGGTIHNNVKITIGDLPAGLTLATANTTTGTGVPSVDTTLTGIEQQGFTLLCHPWSDATTMLAFAVHLELVSSALVQRGRGQVTALGDGDVTAAPADISSAKAVATSVNNWRSTVAYIRGCKAPNYEVAAAFAATMAMQPRPNDSLNGYALNGISIPAVADRLLETEKQLLLNSASGGVVTPLAVEGNSVVIVKAATTYYKNADDSVTKKLIAWQTYRALDYIRLNVNTMEKRYRNKKNSAETRESLRTDVYGVLKLMEKPEYEIVQNVDANRAGITVTVDPDNGERCNVEIPADVIPGLDIIANKIKLI